MKRRKEQKQTEKHVAETGKEAESLLKYLSLPHITISLIVKNMYTVNHKNVTFYF